MWTLPLMRRSVVDDGRAAAPRHIVTGFLTPSLVSGADDEGDFARVDEIVIFRIAAAKIAEAWEAFDEAGMWRQLGVSMQSTASTP